MATVAKRKLQTGTKWEARWTDPSTKRRTKLFERKKDAEAFLDQVKRQIADGIYVSDQDTLSIREAGDAYLQAAITRGIRPETYREYERHLRLHINPAIGDVKLTKVSERQVYEIADAVALGRSTALTKAVLRTLSAVFKEAQKRGWVGRNIIKDKDIRISGSGLRDAYFPTKREIVELIACTSDKHRVMFKTAVLTGLRLGELRALQWRDVDLDNRVTRVQRSATAKGAFKPPKSKAGKREVPLGRDHCLELKKWRLACPHSELDLVFPNEEGRVMCNTNIRRRIFLPAMEKAGLMDDAGKNLFRIHDLRHAAASLLIEQNLNPKRIQTIMGHSDIETTFNVYGKLFRDEDADRTAVDAIGATLFG
jgi:integrase